MKNFSYGDVVVVITKNDKRGGQFGVIVSLYENASGKCLVGVEFSDGEMLEFDDADLELYPS